MTTRRAASAPPSADPEPGDDAAGGVADDVDASAPVRASAAVTAASRASAGGCRSPVPSPGSVDHGGVPAGGGQPLGERTAASRCRRRSPGTSSTGPGPLLGDRPAAGRRGARTAATTRSSAADGDDHERDQEPGRRRRRAGARPASTPLLSLLSPARHRWWTGAGREAAVLSRDEYLAAWSRWHGGTDTDSPLVRGWLTLAYTLARPLAGLPPLVATALGLLVAAAAVAAGRRRRGLADRRRAAGRAVRACWTPSTARWRSAPAAPRGGGSSSTPSSTG